MGAHRRIKNKLRDLCARAEKTGCLLRSHYHDTWFTPERLKQENDNGRFLWGPHNWELVPIKVRVQLLTVEKARLEKCILDVEKEVAMLKEKTE